MHDRKTMYEKDICYNFMLYFVYIGGLKEAISGFLIHAILMLYFVYIGAWKGAISSFLIHAILNRGGKPK